MRASTNPGTPQKCALYGVVIARALGLWKPLDHETEVALRVIGEHLALEAVWYVDLLSEKVVKKKAAPSVGTRREIETVCDDIIIAYGTLIK